MPSDGALAALSGFFDALSDATRLKILCALSVSSMCVTDLAALTGLNQTTCSHQLRILRTSGVVSVKRQGKVMFYSISDGSIPRVMDIAVGAVFDK